MTPLSCAGTRERIHAFHDRELAVGEQIAVAAHVAWCSDCAAALAELETIGAGLQMLARRRAAVSRVPSGSGEDAAGFNAAVIARLKAEREASTFARLRLMFDDLHLVYAGVGAAVSTATCIIVVLGMLSFANVGQPDAPMPSADSLAAMQTSFADLAAFECDASGGAVTGSGCRERRLERAQRANELAAQDAVFALDLVVTHHGRLANLDVLKNGRRSSGEAELIEALLDAVSRSRFDGAPVFPLPSLARVVTTTTFRAGLAMDVPLPPMKKRTAA